MEELISIVLPVYNVENYLDKCITSIISQTYKNFELIIVNDGSTDSSLEICQNYEEADARIQLFSKKNEGVSSARNYGLERIKGEFVTFIDSDDFITENYVKNLVIALKQCNADMSISRFELYYSESKKIEHTKKY